jgi:hypothetical protein
MGMYQKCSGRIPDLTNLIAVARPALYPSSPCHHEPNSDPESERPMSAVLKMQKLEPETLSVHVMALSISSCDSSSCNSKLN